MTGTQETGECWWSEDANAVVQNCHPATAFLIFRTKIRKAKPLFRMGICAVTKKTIGEGKQGTKEILTGTDSRSLRASGCALLRTLTGCRS
jgi:hypothetical protein